MKRHLVFVLAARQKDFYSMEETGLKTEKERQIIRKKIRKKQIKKDK